MLRKKYKNYLKAIVDKLVSNAQANRRLKRILEETREADGESDIRERMQRLKVCVHLLVLSGTIIYFLYRVRSKQFLTVPISCVFTTTALSTDLSLLLCLILNSKAI
ncbi:hypothetical protein SETIT_4G209500v2 [Setaria italica]|uniref:Uncharacterized protein n=1 Tax=Setaria italica TaxID=4555 RepID=A0A368QWU0_SETIT|nr:hypothetical protein SETIT_4G209500v2 [Setaria italica]